jgi:NADPH-dependent 2,4-dienoyl-CoA reductase/sulfur reductase-like enzyme
MSIQRRDFLKAGGAALAAGLAGCATMKSASGPAKARVVVVGGGYGGATAARYVRLLDPTIDVILVEQNESFVSCPLSNMVGTDLGDTTRPYSGLERGVRVVRDTAIAIDAEKKQVRLSRGDAIGFERVIVTPGVDFMWRRCRGERKRAGKSSTWKAGRRRRPAAPAEAMPDGGIYVLSIPEAPYRCLPGP